MRVGIGNGKVVHQGVSVGQRWVAICGARANRTGRNMTAAAYPIDNSVPVTCQKCLEFIEKHGRKDDE